VKPLTSYTCKLDDAQAAALRSWLQEHAYKFREVPYARFAAERDKTNMVFYESGKLVVQGKGTQEFIEFVLEPEILKEIRLGYEAVLNPDLLLPRLGVDESGKGDFFGPLCIAGVYVNEAIVKSWADSGIRDSKKISSDQRIRELAERIRKTPGCVTSVVPIGNETYNRLYTKMRSVNAMLAWGHARVIENLMGQKQFMQPAPVRAISDQFASSKETVAGAIMALGRDIELVRFPIRRAGKEVRPGIAQRRLGCRRCHRQRIHRQTRRGRIAQSGEDAFSYRLTRPGASRAPQSGMAPPVSGVFGVHPLGCPSFRETPHAEFQFPSH
jgi:ribonuclease HIII